MLFVTGFPGFLASALLPRLLAADPDARAVALVQPRHRPLAEARARALADALGRPDAVRLVDGDVTRPDLGLGAGYAPLQAGTTGVWHLAAVYDLAATDALAEAVNVEGTRHVLRFAAGAPGLRRFDYVSTCYVAGRHRGAFREADLDVGQRFFNAYERTKFVAEALVRDAAAGGLPAAVYRPGVVVGDSQTGETQKADGPYGVLRWLLRWPRAAPLPLFGDPDAHRVNLVPRDFVVDALAALGADPSAVGGTFALADPAPPTVAEAVRLFAHATDRRVLPVRLPEGALPLVARLPGFERLTGIQPAALPYFAHPTAFDTARARTALAPHGVACPSLAGYVGALVGYLRAHPDLPAHAMT